MSTLFIPIIEGTTRVKRESIHAARFILEVSKEIPGIETVLVDPNDFTLPGDGNDPESKDPKYTELTLKADAFFIVAPEYNHSFSGSLKRLLDSELTNYKHKPVAFAGVSSGMIGGARAIEALTMTTRKMGLVTLSHDVHFPFVQDLFNEDGSVKDQAYVERVKKVFTELIWMANALKTARETTPQA